jgi:hypothetical protein
MSRALWWVTNGRAAAPPGDRVQRRALDLDEPVRRQRGEWNARSASAQETAPTPLGIDQVEVPHPLPQLGVGQSVMLSGGGSIALHRKCSFGEDRQLARVGPPQLAVHADWPMNTCRSPSSHGD